MQKDEFEEINELIERNRERSFLSMLMNRKPYKLKIKNVLLFDILVISLFVLPLSILIYYNITEPNISLEVYIKIQDEIVTNKELTYETCLEWLENDIVLEVNSNKCIQIKKEKNDSIEIYHIKNDEYMLRLYWWNHQPALNIYDRLSIEEIKHIIRYYYKHNSGTIIRNYEWNLISSEFHL